MTTAAHAYQAATSLLSFPGRFDPHRSGLYMLAMHVEHVCGRLWREALLAVLAKEPGHGYEFQQALETEFLRRHSNVAADVSIE